MGSRARGPGPLGAVVLTIGLRRRELNGGPHSDLLIGNNTVYDRNLSALMTIFAEWTSRDSLPTRMQKLRTGLGVPRLDASTVLEDSARDDLFAEGEMDWVFATGLDKVHGHRHDRD